MPEPPRVASLSPYLPRLVLLWLDREPDRTARELYGSMAFVDISGFTKMSERLARRGKVGGDALLVFFSGREHPLRAVRAAAGMRRELHRIGRISTSAGFVQLRMSVGVHSGRFEFFLVG